MATNFIRQPSLEPAADVLQSHLPDLVTAIKDNVQAVCDNCLASKIITEETYGKVLSTGIVKDADKARSLLVTVLSCVKTNKECYDVFINILSEVLPSKGSEKLLKDMEKSLKEKVKFAEQCTDQEPQAAKRQGPGEVDLSFTAGSDKLLAQATVKVNEFSEILDIDGTSDDRKPPAVINFPAPIQVSETAKGKSECIPPEQSVPASPQTRMLKLIAELAQGALLPSQQDDAERHNLHEENKLLKEANKKEKKIAKKIESEKDRVETLNKQKEDEVARLQREISEVRSRLSEYHESYAKLEGKLSSVETEYNAKIEKHQEKMADLKDKLKETQVVIKEKESSVQKLRKTNRRLSKQNSKKDEEISYLQRFKLPCFKWVIAIFVIMCLVLATIILLDYFMPDYGVIHRYKNSDGDCHKDDL